MSVPTEARCGKMAPKIQCPTGKITRATAAKRNRVANTLRQRAGLRTLSSSSRDSG
jgi:hypothetical protein